MVSEVEVVRALCAFLRATGNGNWLLDGADIRARAMVAVGRAILELQQGAGAAAIPTPSGPLVIKGSAKIDAIGTTIEVPNGRPWSKVEGEPRTAVVAIALLLALGGPMESVRPADMTAAERDAVAGVIVEKLREGRVRAELPEHNIEITIDPVEPARWMLTKGEIVVVERDAWDRLRAELARLMAE